MPKPDDDTQYHVTLCHPMRVKMNGYTLDVLAFDGVMSFDGPALPGFMAFRTDCVYVDLDGRLLAKSRRTIRIQLIVPSHNISGLVPQPFEKKA